PALARHGLGEPPRLLYWLGGGGGPLLPQRQPDVPLLAVAAHAKKHRGTVGSLGEPAELTRIADGFSVDFDDHVAPHEHPIGRPSRLDGHHACPAAWRI